MASSPCVLAPERGGCCPRDVLGMLIDNREFQRTCDFYYGDITFQEAYERSHKHISITVSASQLGSKWQVRR